MVCQNPKKNLFIKTHGTDSTEGQDIGAALMVGFGSTVAQAHNQGKSLIFKLHYQRKTAQSTYNSYRMTMIFSSTLYDFH